jgi:hypothetical protein
MGDTTSVTLGMCCKSLTGERASKRLTISKIKDKRRRLLSPHQ